MRSIACRRQHHQFVPGDVRAPRATPAWNRSATTADAAQRLHLLNSSHIQRKIEQGRMVQPFRSRRNPREDRRDALPDDPLALSHRRGIQGRGRAKSVIQIWMWGGPAHLDTFDPKPDAGYDYCGPLNKPIATNVPGIASASCCRCWPSRPTSIPSSAA
jgi:hypothetical protein